MKFRKTMCLVLAVSFLSLAANCLADSKEENQAKVRKAVNDTLNDLYKLQPLARTAIANSAGYAVFKNFGTNILVVSTGSGKGIAFNSKTKQETFMKMVSAGAGLGIGVKDFRAIFVFGTDEAFNKFLDSGWSASGQADAAAKAGEKGGAYSGAAEVAPNVWVYQITKNGLALQLTLQGTKYYKDDDLNK
jgi:lipid-binding SYLF domain-containing protein